MVNLPSVSSPLPRDLQQFIRRVREALDGGGPDAVVTARQLIATGLVKGVAGSNGIVAADQAVIETPRAPRSVTTAGALASIIVSWASPNYKGHAYAEVWAASRTAEQEAADPPETPSLGQAELVGMTAGNNFSHNIGGGAERWYWVRFINQNGLAGPYNLTDGTFGQTSVDPEYVLEVLTDAVTSSQLATSLLSTINTTFSQSSAPTQKPDGTALVAGDLWYDTSSSNEVYRYNGSEWVSARDGGIAQAITAAGGAQGTADGKITTYYQTTAPSNVVDGVIADVLSEGDLWVDTDDQNNLYRWSADSSDTTDGGTWVDIQDGGIGDAISAASDAQSTADKKTITFFQDDAPTTSDEAELSTGDLWVDTDDGNKLYRYQVTGQDENGDDVLEWVTIRDGGIQTALDNAATAQSTADGKILTFYQDDAPTTNDNADLGLGDIWFDTNDGRKMYRYQVNGQDQNGDDTFGWVAIPDANIAQAIQDAADAQSTADGKITSYYQDDPPTNANGELSEGDLWTDTDDDDATYRWDDDGGQNATGEWVRIGLASFTDVNTAITDQVGYCELSIVSGGTTTKSVSTANTTQTLCQAAQADPNKPSNYAYAWKSDGAIASELKTVTSSVDGNTASIQTNVESIDGIEANFTVKTDVGGHIAGFGLLSTAATATPTSEFGVRADKFFIAPPATSSNTAPTTNLFKGKVWVDTSTTPSVVKYYDPTANNNVGGWTTTQITNLPFVVNTTPTTINGQSVGAGAYIDTAFIADATITQAQIGTLNADVINSGLLNTVDFYGNTIAGSTIYLGGTVTYNTDADGNNIGIQSVANANATLTSTGINFTTSAFTISNGSGTDYTPFQVVNGAVLINNAIVGDIESSNYDAANNDGWKLSKNGDLDLNSATITAGVLQSEDGNFEINLTNGTITISA